MNVKPNAADYERSIDEMIERNTGEHRGAVRLAIAVIRTRAAELAASRVAGEQEAQGEPVAPLGYISEPMLQILKHGEFGTYDTQIANVETRDRKVAIYAAPQAREPSVSVAELRELVEKWRQPHVFFQECRRELKALCDRASDGRE